MTLKQLVTAALLVFVAASVGVVIYRNVGAEDSVPQETAPATTAAAQTPPGSRVIAAGEGETAGEATAGEPRFLAMYIHGARRCRLCVNMQNNARAAVREVFSGLIADGTLAWRDIDLGRPGNRHYATDYDVRGSGVVVAEIDDNGEPLRYKHLGGTWQIANDAQQMRRYIHAEIQAFMANAEEYDD